MTQREEQSGRWLSRRRFLTGLAVTAATGRRARLEAVAAEGLCPHVAGRRIRWIVPYALGGGYDLESRLLEPVLEEILGAQIVLENRTGAAGVIGSRALAQAGKDGLTLGILNGSGILIAALGGENGAPHPLRDLTVLARIGRNRNVVVTGSQSPLHTVEDLIEVSAKRPLLAAAAIGSTSFVSTVVMADLLHMNVRPLLGYNGSGGSALAAMRGDVDILSYTYDSLRPLIENGDLRPLLQVADAPSSSHPALANVPLLGGTSGWAVRRANESGRSARVAEDDARGLSTLLGAGRVVAAPSGLPTEVSRCLEQALAEALGDPRFATSVARSGRTLDVASGAAARRDFQEASQRSDRFMPLFTKAIREITG